MEEDNGLSSRYLFAVGEEEVKEVQLDGHGRNTNEEEVFTQRPEVEPHPHG